MRSGFIYDVGGCSLCLWKFAKYFLFLLCTNALDFVIRHGYSAFFYHVHLVNFFWSLYQMPKCSLASDSDTPNPISKFPALSNQKWMVQKITINQSPKYSKVNGFCFKYSRISHTWKNLAKFSSPGNSIHAAPDLGGAKEPGPRAPHQTGTPTMFMCLAICTTCACHSIIFISEEICL